MSSRKAEKERLRQAREERELERHRAERQRRRLKLFGTVLVAAVIVVLIAIAVSGGNSKNSNSPKVGKDKGAAQVNARFQGIPQQNLTLGNPKAPVTLVEFADLKCPVCRQYTLSAFPTLVSRYVRTGKVKMVLQLQHFVGNQNGDSERAARMALAAGKQNKLWQFADLFYLNQRDETETYVNDPFLRQIASRVNGLDVNKALAARSQPAITQELQQASSEFNTAGFDGTPSFAVGKTGKPLSPINYNSFDVSQFSGPIDKLLGGGT